MTVRCPMILFFGWLELGSWVGGRRVSACNLRTLEAEKVERVSMHRSR